MVVDRAKFVRSPPPSSGTTKNTCVVRSEQTVKTCCLKGRHTLVVVTTFSFGMLYPLGAFLGMHSDRLLG